MQDKREVAISCYQLSFQFCKEERVFQESARKTLSVHFEFSSVVSCLRTRKVNEQENGYLALIS